jgi:hypothetical protein
VRVLRRLLRLEAEQRLFVGQLRVASHGPRLGVGPLGGPAGRHGKCRDDKPDHRQEEEDESKDHSGAKDALVR